MGAANVDHETPSEDMGVVVAWRAAFPEVLGDSGVVGYDREAPKNGISGFAVLPKDESEGGERRRTRTTSPSRPRDVDGHCAGGVLSGYPDPTEDGP